MNREELIAKHSTKKTFIEDVGVAPENAWREDKAGDKSMLSLTCNPKGTTPSYKNRWKWEQDELCDLEHVFKHPKLKKAHHKRYHGKEFQKTFNRPEVLQKVRDMSKYLKPDWNYDPRIFVRVVHDFIDENEDKS